MYKGRVLPKKNKCDIFCGRVMKILVVLTLGKIKFL